MVLLLTCTHDADAVLRRYLQARPEHERELIEMLVKAEQHGFVAWERVTREIVAPAASAALRWGPRTTQV
jgi:hypothetical protein